MSLNTVFTPGMINFISDSIVKGRNDNHWVKFVNNARPWELKYRRKLRQFWAEQADWMLTNLSRKSKTMPEDLINLNDWQIRFEEFGQLMLPQITEDWGQQELNTVITGLSFDVIDPNVTEFVNTYAYRFSFEINKETNKLLNELFARSINAGDGIPQLEKRIRWLFADMDKYRAVRIARTEVIRAQNFGAEESYIQSNVVSGKEWWTARDERRCLFCAELHGKRIDLRRNYYNQGDALEVERDGEIQRLRLNYEDIKRPPLHPHCRCTLIPIVVE